MFSLINAFFKQRPLLVSLVGNTVKTAAADIVTQKVIEQKEQVDIKRLGLFTIFGFGYLGGWQYFLFNKAFVKCEQYMALRRYSKATTSGILTFLDLGVHTPFLYFPAFYSLKGYIDGHTVHETANKFKDNIKNDIISMWRLWLPAQLINFSCIPVHMRMPFITCISFGWTIILSMQRGGNK